MRIGAHYGPAYRAIDHITGRLSFYGTEVSKAARIEPVTPTGAVFVTEPFAAILALEAPDRFDCRYVGRIQLAKGYGELSDVPADAGGLSAQSALRWPSADRRVDSADCPGRR